MKTKTVLQLQFESWLMTEMKHKMDEDQLEQCIEYDFEKKQYENEIIQVMWASYYAGYFKR